MFSHQENSNELIKSQISTDEYLISVSNTYLLFSFKRCYIYGNVREQKHGVNEIHKSQELVLDVQVPVSSIVARAWHFFPLLLYYFTIWSENRKKHNVVIPGQQGALIL